jgi:hypothetical protein
MTGVAGEIEVNFYMSDMRRQNVNLQNADRVSWRSTCLLTSQGPSRTGVRRLCYYGCMISRAKTLS